MSKLIKALDYSSEHIGKYFKSSSTIHQWLIQIDKKSHQISYITYKWKAKRKILTDNILIFQSFKSHPEFSHTFHLSSHILTITEQGPSIDLHIDGLSFSILNSRQAGSFISIDEKEDLQYPLILKLHSTYSEKGKIQTDWEAKARPYRLKDHEFIKTQLRERINILPRLHLTTSSTLSAVSIVATPSPSRLQSQISSLAHKKRPKRKIMNFFLLI